MRKLPPQTKEYFSLCGGRHLALLISLLWKVSLPGFGAGDNYKGICCQGLQVGEREARKQETQPLFLVAEASSCSK
jgi:hypothetical protein